MLRLLRATFKFLFGLWVSGAGGLAVIRAQNAYLAAELMGAPSPFLQSLKVGASFFYSWGLWPMVFAALVFSNLPPASKEESVEIAPTEPK